MLLFDAPLTFREFIVHEDVPLADVFREVLSFLPGRDDAVLFGAQAVNAYCDPPRMTGDIDLLSTRARELAETLCAVLSERFHITIRVREVADGRGFRVYQLRKPKNRHLVDVRQVDAVPAFQRFEGVRVIAPADLAALKVQSIAARTCGRTRARSPRACARSTPRMQCSPCGARSSESASSPTPTTSTEREKRSAARTMRREQLVYTVKRY